MMILIMMWLMVGGIGLAQAISDPGQVTLRWLRLGGLIAVALLAVGMVGQLVTNEGAFTGRTAVWALAVAAPFVVQLMAVQLGWRRTQRVAAIAGFLAVWAALAAPVWVGNANDFFTISMDGGPSAGPQKPPDAPAQPPAQRSTMEKIGYTWAVGVSAGLLGGFLMTMLLGHGYLTAGGEMTQAPFRRLVLFLAVLLAVRLLGSLLFGLWPYLAVDVPRGERLWNAVMIAARYLVGIAAPGVFTYMTYDCVQRRANQSATGILYVAGVLIIVGEGASLALFGATGLGF